MRFAEPDGRKMCYKNPVIPAITSRLDMVEPKQGRASTVGRNIADIRRRKGLTLDELAKLSSVSRASISALERGADNPRVQTLWNLADALGVNFGTLVGHGGDERVVDDDGVNVRLIQRDEGRKVVEAYLMEIPAGVARDAEPHVSGVTEHVVVLSGEMRTGPTDGASLLEAGQSVSFAADAPHTYAAGREDARAIVTVVYPGLGD